MPVAIVKPPGAFAVDFQAFNRSSFPNKETPFTVQLPGWDDIIHIVPRSALSQRERNEARGRTLTSLNNSPTPEVVNAVASVGQKIDNVQDGLVTLSVLGRLATKITGRVIPGVGQITLAADALNAFNVFYPNTLAAKALDASRSLIHPTRKRERFSMSKETKRQLGLLGIAGTGVYSQRLSKTAMGLGVRFGFGELLQILQTTDQLFGVGLSLGPIFGTIQDSFFGALRGARFDVSGPINTAFDWANKAVLPIVQSFLPSEAEILSGVAQKSRVKVSVDFPGVIPSVDALLGRPVGTYEREVEVAIGPEAAAVARSIKRVTASLDRILGAGIKSAVSVFKSGLSLVGLREDLPWSDHLEIAVAQGLAMQTLKPYLVEGNLWPRVAVALQAPSRSLGPVLFVGPEGAPVGDVLFRIATGVARKPLAWIDEIPSDLGRAFARSVVDNFVTDFLESVREPGTAVLYRQNDYVKAMELLHDYDLGLPYQRTDGQVLELTERCASAVCEAKPFNPTFDDFRSIWKSVFPSESLGV